MRKTLVLKELKKNVSIVEFVKIFGTENSFAVEQARLMVQGKKSLLKRIKILKEIKPYRMLSSDTKVVKLIILFNLY